MLVTTAMLATMTVGGAPAIAQDASRGATSAGRDQQLAQLQAASGGQLRVSLHGATGFARMVGADAGATMAGPRGVADNATGLTVAAAFLDQYGQVFGIADAAGDLTVIREERALASGSAVRFQQHVDGVPVLGGELVVRMDDQHRVQSVFGEALPSTRVGTRPSITAAAAATTARGLVAKHRGVDASELTTSTPALAVFDRGIFGGPGEAETRLVWQVDVSAAGLRHFVLIDAVEGFVVLDYDNLHTAKSRTTCDDASVPRDPQILVECGVTAGLTVVRTEGSANSGNAQVDAAHNFAGGFYDLLFNQFGRDSLDDAGHPLGSTVNLCLDGETCPYQNAFWSGFDDTAQMYYGQGFATDDIVGHELAHGYTEATSNLYYYFQSGAINESLSDVFGELYDQRETTGGGNDAAGVKWLLGEDIGAIRDMEDPTVFSDPDKMSSGNYVTGPGDNGGVHSNSGVNNKATFLMTDGGTFNGETVSALGAAKVLAIYNEVQMLLTSSSDFAHLADALVQGCQNVVGTIPPGGTVIAVDDCDDVVAAVAAVEMAAEPQGATVLLANACVLPLEPDPSYLEDVESLAPGWSVSRTGSDVDLWDLSVGHAYESRLAFRGFDGQNAGVTSISQDSAHLVPPNSFLSFRHVHDFETDGGGNYDGGVVEYSVNAGATWLDAGPLFDVNGYRGTMSASFANPLGGRSAFVGPSGGWMVSRMDLSSLAGQSIRIRFSVATDELVGRRGWFVDDIQIHTCADIRPPAFAGAAALVASAITESAVTLTWPAATDNFNVTGYVVRRDGADVATLGAGARNRTVTGLGADTLHDFEVVAVDDAGNESDPLGTSARTLDTTPPAFPGGAALTVDQITETSVRLSWPTASDNGTVAGYVVTQDGVEIAAPTATTAPVTGLDPATSYDFKVVAVDTQDNESTPLAATGTTIDATAPTFGPGATLAASNVTPDQIRVIWPAATDAVAVDHYLVSVDGGSARRVDTTVPGGTLTFLATNLTEDTSYDLSVIAVDAADNASTPLEVTARTTLSVVPGVVRLQGESRYDTAAAISKDAFPDGAATVYVATGGNFPDALAAGPVAGIEGAPILLVAPSGVPDATRTELQRLAPTQIVVLGGPAAVSAAIAQELGSIATVRRIEGEDRFATAVAISSSAFAPGVPVTYVATGRNFPDALAGAALAGTIGGPVLLVNTDAIPDVVAAELDRLKSGRIVILGGATAVSADVQTALADHTDGTVTRIEGATRYETAAKIGAEFPASTSVVYIATGRNFPDALAATPSAIGVGGPILLVPGDSIPSEVAAELQRLSPLRIVVLGGPVAVTEDVATALTGFLPSSG